MEDLQSSIMGKSIYITRRWPDYYENPDIRVDEAMSILKEIDMDFDAISGLQQKLKDIKNALGSSADTTSLNATDYNSKYDVETIQIDVESHTKIWKSIEVYQKELSLIESEEWTACDQVGSVPKGDSRIYCLLFSNRVFDMEKVKGLQ